MGQFMIQNEGLLGIIKNDTSHMVSVLGMMLQQIKRYKIKVKDLKSMKV